MCIPVRTLSLIRQVVHTKFNHRVQLKCNRPNARATPFGRGSIQERISNEFGKQIAQLSVQMPSATVRTPPRKIALVMI